ncbi:MAG: 2-phosphosulfolactate phosphatase [Bacteroidetes bacterium]|nr:MAG: 2-phosphosulfolactate phosphatase [Bacteroidota bacterium]
MKIRVIPYAAAVHPQEIAGKTTIIIDVLRATSVIITALKNGADKIIPALTVEEALETSKKLTPGTFLLCGERDTIKIEGFDLGNSPLEFRQSKVAGKTLIMTTSNGTQALNASRVAAKVYLGAFLNAKAVAEKVKQEKEVVLVCSGTAGRFSLDDGLCAAMIMEELSKSIPLRPDDLGLALAKIWQSENGSLQKLLKDSFHLNYLLQKGFAGDVDYCLQKNSTSVVPVFSGSEIILS